MAAGQSAATDSTNSNSNSRKNNSDARGGTRNGMILLLVDEVEDGRGALGEVSNVLPNDIISSPVHA
jgi:hypothetical protein